MVDRAAASCGGRRWKVYYNMHMRTVMVGIVRRPSSIFHLPSSLSLFFPPFKCRTFVLPAISHQSSRHFAPVFPRFRTSLPAIYRSTSDLELDLRPSLRYGGESDRGEGEWYHDDAKPAAAQQTSTEPRQYNIQYSV